MNKERVLYGILAVTFVTYVVLEQYRPKPLDWTPTFSHLDKNPFGAYVLYDRLGDFFQGGKEVAFQTFYEQENGEGQLIVLASQFDPSDADIKSLFHILEQGRDVLIGAEYFSSQFQDTMGIEDVTIKVPDIEYILAQDSLSVRFNDEQLYYPFTVLKTHFQLDKDSVWTTHAQTDQPVVISKEIGKGRLVLTSVPLALTNFGILHHGNHSFTEHLLGLLADGHAVYNRYYQSGRGESSTPLRYLLSQPSLRWAVFLSLFGVVLLLVVESQRRQRSIPLLEPRHNSTVQFIKTIGGLYYRESNHQAVAMKLIQYFLKNLKDRYHLLEADTEAGYRLLAAKTGLKVSQVIETFDLIRSIRNRKKITEEELKSLSAKINLYQ